MFVPKCDIVIISNFIATGEPPLCMSVVVLFALRYALESARKDAGIKEPWFELSKLTLFEAYCIQFINFLFSRWSGYIRGNIFESRKCN